MAARRGRSPVGAILRAIVHDLAQPAASATLSAEIAAIELQRGNPEAARHRLAAATEALDAAQRLLRAYGAAASGPGGALGPQVADPAGLVAGIFPAADLAPCPPVAFPPDLLLLVLGRLARLLGPDGLRCRLAPESRGRAVRLRLSGRAAPPAELAPWVALLRLAGATVRCRPGVVVISLPDSAGATRNQEAIRDDQ